MVTNLYGKSIFPNLSDDYNDVFSSWNKSIMSVMEDMRSGKIKPEELNADLFTSTKGKLLSGIKTGSKSFDFSKLDYASKDYNFLNHARKNVYAFAGAKTYQHLRAMNDMLLDSKGNIVPFPEFKRSIEDYRVKAMGLEDTYNKVWLKTEYDTAISQSQSAARWKEFEANADVLPNLKYVTVGDERVRHSHEVLDGIIKPINDPIWAKIAPVKEWNCRCHLENTDEEPTGDMPKGYNPDPVFEGNAAQTGSIFPEKHPYFKKNRIDMRKIEEKTEGYWADERIRINSKIYNDFASDNDYVREHFDHKTGGFIVRHINSETTLSGLPMSEKAVIDLLVQKGNRIILPEFSVAPMTKNFDLTIDSSDWDIKTISGNVKRRTEESIRTAMDQADNVILSFTQKPNISDIERGLGNVKNLKRLNSVMIIYKDTIAVLNKSEIKVGNFDALRNAFK